MNDTNDENVTSMMRTVRMVSTKRTNRTKQMMSTDRRLRTMRIAYMNRVHGGLC